MTCRFCLVAVCVIGLATAARAELLVQEQFPVGGAGYTAGPILDAGDPATLGLAGDWTRTDGSVTLVPSPVFYVGTNESGDAVTTGERVAVDLPGTANNGVRVNRSYSSDLNGTVVYENSGDSFYASFMAEPADVSGSMYLDLGFVKLDDSGQAHTRFGMTGGAYYVTKPGSGREASGGTVTPGNQRIVVKYEYNSDSNNELVTMWVDPTDESSPKVLDQASVNVLDNGGGKLMDTWSMRIVGASMVGEPSYFDDLRLGTTFADVVPEPGSAWLLAMALLGLAWRRRRT